MDTEGWWSVTPEVLARHQSLQCRKFLEDYSSTSTQQHQKHQNGNSYAAGESATSRPGWGIALDAMAGCAGNVIQMAQVRISHMLSVMQSVTRAGSQSVSQSVRQAGRQADVALLAGLQAAGIHPNCRFDFKASLHEVAFVKTRPLLAWMWCAHRTFQLCTLLRSLRAVLPWLPTMLPCMGSATKWR
jgi:hypothetical protein